MRFPYSDIGDEAPTEDARTLGQKAVGAAAWIAVDKWATRISSLVVFALLGRLVAPSDFGLIALATVYLAFVSVFIDSGFSQALIQREDMREEHATAAFWISMTIGTVAALIVAGAAPVIGALSGDDALVPVLQALSVTLPLTALSSVPAALLGRDFDYRSLAIRRLAATAAASTVAIGFAVAGAGVWALVAQSITFSAVGVMVLWRVSPWRPALRFSRRAARDLARFGTSVFGIELVQLANAHADKLLIGLFIGPTQLGYYFVGTRITLVILEMLTAVTGSLSLPTFSRLQDSPKRMRRVLQDLTFVNSAVAFPGFAISAALAPALIPLVFGEGWSESVIIMQLSAPAAAMASITWFDKGLFLGAGKPGAAFAVSVGQAILGVALLAVAVPYGIAAVAVSRSLRTVLFWPVRVALMRRAIELEIWPYTRQFIGPGVAAAVAAGAIVAIQQSNWAFQTDIVAVAVLAPFAVSLYLAVLWVLARAKVVRVMSFVLGPRQPAWLRRQGEAGAR